MNPEKKLRKIGLKPGKGQNFLSSEPVIDALVEAGEPDGKKVLEIGGGTGALTKKIQERALNTTVVEKNGLLADYLQNNFRNIKILGKDFRDIKFNRFERCISNIPFQHSKEILEKLGKAQLQSALIVQEELADKIVAEPGSKKYSETTIRINYFFIPVKLRKIPSSSFYPPPEVDGAILKLYPNVERHGIEKRDDFLRLTKALFTNSRKKVRNAFVDSRHILEMEKEQAKKIRDELPHSEKRVNELEIIELENIRQSIQKKLN